MSDPQGYDDDLFDRHIDAIRQEVTAIRGFWSVERWVLVDVLLDHRLAFPVLEARMVVDWLLVNLVCHNNRTLISRREIDSTLSELRMA